MNVPVLRGLLIIIGMYKYLALRVLWHHVERGWGNQKQEQAQGVGSDHLQQH